MEFISRGSDKNVDEKNWQINRTSEKMGGKGEKARKGKKLNVPTKHRADRVGNVVVPCVQFLLTQPHLQVRISLWKMSRDEALQYGK